MKQVVFAIVLGAGAMPALADGFVLGSGRWTCAQAIQVFDTGTGIQKGQLVGWLMGYWTGATFTREKTFVDTVESVGGRKIADATIAECRNAKPETLIYRIADSMIRNTK
jgi:hypothetical protein